MPTMRIPNVISFYTDKRTQFPVRGSTVSCALHDAVEQFPKLKFHIMDGDGNLRRHVRVFINEVLINDLEGLDTKVAEGDVIQLLVSAAGG